MKNLKVLVVGSGGREHAIAWELAHSQLVKQVYCAPGNPGTAVIAQNLDIKANDIEGLKVFAKSQGVDLTVVGPEEPLALGIVDEFEKEGLKIFGPSKAAAQMESSKYFAKQIFEENNIPTAPYHDFDNVDDAHKFAELTIKGGAPCVVKLDGLAAGRGVWVCSDENKLKGAFDDIKSGKFGSAANKILVEQRLYGHEVTFIVMVDKKGNIVPLATSQDHKQLYQGDVGPNTGGMGAFSPVDWINTATHNQIMGEIVIPTVMALQKRGTPFVGFLYFGLMFEFGKHPHVLETNVRLGDPEAQAILMRLKIDLARLILDALEGNLNAKSIEWDAKKSVCVVAVSKGYPDSYKTGHVVYGIHEAHELGARVYHAGTGLNNYGQLVNTGGRVLSVAALGDSFEEAQLRAYEGIGQISFQDMYFRKDIGDGAIPLTGCGCAGTCGDACACREGGEKHEK